jgi:hypothetical protein
MCRTIRWGNDVPSHDDVETVGELRQLCADHQRDLSTIIDELDPDLDPVELDPDDHCLCGVGGIVGEVLTVLGYRFEDEGDLWVTGAPS